MFRRSHSPKASISNVLYSDDSIVRKFLFRRFDVPKVLEEYLCSESPIVRWILRLCNVRWPCGPTVRLTWFKYNGEVFSQQCVTTVTAGWSFINVWNRAYSYKCLFSPLMMSGAYIWQGEGLWGAKWDKPHVYRLLWSRGAQSFNLMIPFKELHHS